MPTLNRYECIGRLGRNPTLSKVQGEGTPVLRFSLAVDKPNGGEPMWLNVVVWEDLALRMNELLKQGMLIYVEAHLRLRTYIPKGKDPSDPTENKLAVDIVAYNIQILEKIQRSQSREEQPVEDGE